MEFHWDSLVLIHSPKLKPSSLVESDPNFAEFFRARTHARAHVGLIEGRRIGTAHHPRRALRPGGAGLLRSRRPRQWQ